MTNLHAHGAVTGTKDRSRPRGALRVLCATQITSWPAPAGGGTSGCSL